MSTKEEFIEIKDGISVTDQRKLIETTQIMAKVLTRPEFINIMGYYNRIIDTLVKEDISE